MGKNNNVFEETEETSKKFQGSGKCTGFENVRAVIADKIRNVAEAIAEKAPDQDTQADTAQCRIQVSGWLNQSAECIRQFDFEQVDTKVREYVRQSPGRSLLISGGVGLIIGAILGRR